MWLCQETGWAWLRKVGVSASAGESRLRLRRGYEQPASKVRRGRAGRHGHSSERAGLAIVLGACLPRLRAAGQQGTRKSMDGMRAASKRLSMQRCCLHACRCFEQPTIRVRLSKHGAVQGCRCGLSSQVAASALLQAALEKEADLRQEELDDASAGSPVSRLVLVVHGIGQKLEAANIAQARVCCSFQVLAALLDPAGGARDWAKAGGGQHCPGGLAGCRDWCPASAQCSCRSYFLLHCTHTHSGCLLHPMCPCRTRPASAACCARWPRTRGSRARWTSRQLQVNGVQSKPATGV